MENLEIQFSEEKSYNCSASAESIGVKEDAPDGGADNGKTLKIVFRTTNHKAFILNGAKSKEILEQEFLEVSSSDL